MVDITIFMIILFWEDFLDHPTPELETEFATLLTYFHCTLCFAMLTHISCLRYYMLLCELHAGIFASLMPSIMQVVNIFFLNFSSITNS